MPRGTPRSGGGPGPPLRARGPAACALGAHRGGGAAAEAPGWGAPAARDGSVGMGGSECCWAQAWARGRLACVSCVAVPSLADRSGQSCLLQRARGRRRIRRRRAPRCGTLLASRRGCPVAGQSHSAVAAGRAAGLEISPPPGARAGAAPLLPRRARPGRRAAPRLFRLSAAAALFCVGLLVGMCGRMTFRGCTSSLDGRLTVRVCVPGCV
jgi:hypothetical protein